MAPVASSSVSLIGTFILYNWYHKFFMNTISLSYGGGRIKLFPLTSGVPSQIKLEGRVWRGKSHKGKPRAGVEWSLVPKEKLEALWGMYKSGLPVLIPKR